MVRRRRWDGTWGGGRVAGAGERDCVREAGCGYFGFLALPCPWGGLVTRSFSLSRYKGDKRLYITRHAAMKGYPAHSGTPPPLLHTAETPVPAWCVVAGRLPPTPTHPPNSAQCSVREVVELVVLVVPRRRLRLRVAHAKGGAHHREGVRRTARAHK